MYHKALYPDQNIRKYIHRTTAARLTPDGLGIDIDEYYAGGAGGDKCCFVTTVVSNSMVWVWDYG